MRMSRMITFRFTVRTLCGLTLIVAVGCWLALPFTPTVDAELIADRTPESVAIDRFDQYTMEIHNRGLFPIWIHGPGTSVLCDAIPEKQSGESWLVVPVSVPIYDSLRLESGATRHLRLAVASGADELRIDLEAVDWRGRRGHAVICIDTAESHNHRMHDESASRGF